MIIMALDHVRDYFHSDSFQHDPLDPATTTPFLFFTRFITHFCAPTFVFLAGTSAYLMGLKKTKAALSGFLLKRGLWLILIEVVLISLAWTFNPIFDAFLFQVIWAIGASMVIMAALIHLPARAIWISGLAIVFIHNLLEMIPITPEHGAGFVIWGFFTNTFFYFEGSPIVMVPYPMLPWLGIMMSGFGVGLLFSPQFDTAKRKKYLLYIGTTAVLLFIVLRFFNLYGDPRPWSVQKDSLFTVMSFINTTKYPPSLMYTLMTLGPVMMILSWMENANLNVLKPLNVFGRVPLFYYILHFALIHATAKFIYATTNHVDFSKLTFRFTEDFGIPAEGRYSLGGVYAAWFCVVLFLYPICVWYNRYKSTHRNWWLSYL